MGYPRSGSADFSLWWLLVAEHRLRPHGLQSSWPVVSTGSLAAMHRLSCSVTWGTFLNPGLNLCLLHGQADSLRLSHKGSPIKHFIALKICSKMVSPQTIYTLCPIFKFILRLTYSKWNIQVQDNSGSNVNTQSRRILHDVFSYLASKFNICEQRSEI